jgi:6-phosphogluconolactonase
MRFCVMGLLGAMASAAAAFGQPGEPVDAGQVYTMSNEAAGNRLLSFGRGPNGMLSAGPAVASGGGGTGTGLGNQGGVVFGPHERFIYAVNAGSGEISVFLVAPGRPILIQVVDSGGSRPISLTHRDGLLYVLNADGEAAGADHINGFFVTPQGLVRAIPSSERPLSALQIGFTPDGRALIVTEKMTSLIDVFPLQSGGLAGQGTTSPSAGETPFGFGFDRAGHLIVSEAFGGMPGMSAVSSYSRHDATLMTISASIPTTQTAACWIALTADSRFVYTTNTGSGTVTGYGLNRRSGALTRLDAGVTGNTGSGSTPIDAGTVGNRFLYVLSPGTARIDGFQVRQDGSLDSIGGIGGLPASANGLAVR